MMLSFSNSPTDHDLLSLPPPPSHVRAILRRAGGTRPRRRLGRSENCSRRNGRRSRSGAPSFHHICPAELKFLYRRQFTGSFDSSNGDDTALLSDINSRAQGLRQAVNKDEKHTLSPEAIIRYVLHIISRAHNTCTDVSLADARASVFGTEHWWLCSLIYVICPTTTRSMG